MGLLHRINKQFGKKKETKATRLQNPGGLNIPLASTRNAQARQLQVDFLSITKWAYRGNELVHSCMDERSRALKEAPLKIFDEKNDEWDENNPVELLMRRPNPFRLQADLLETIEQHLSLTGNAFVRKVRDQKGVVRELWIMQPHLVGIIPDSKTFIRGYTYKVDGQKYPLPVEDVIHLLYSDPADDYFGISPLVAASRRIDADSELGKFTKQLLLNMAVTSGCFVTEKKLNKEERAIMEDKLASRYVGAVRAGLPMVLSHGMKWEQTSMNMKDLEIGNIAAILESRICLALHVPAVVVGAKVGLDKSTFTNVREAREYMYENTISPEWQMIADKLGGALLIDFGHTDGNLIARFDTSKIKALQESEQALWERVRQSKSLSVIEKRLKLGYPSEPNGAIFIDANMVAINPETGEMQPRVAEIEAGVKKDQNLDDGEKTEEDDKSLPNKEPQAKNQSPLCSLCKLDKKTVSPTELLRLKKEAYTKAAKLLKLIETKGKDGSTIEDWEYLLHHLHEDGKIEEVHHCPLIDHLGNLYEVEHLEDNKGEIRHVLIGLLEDQEVYWSDEEAEVDGQAVPCSDRQLK